MPRLLVVELPHMIRFYTELLGFEVGSLWRQHAPRFAILDRDDVCVQLYVPEGTEGEPVGHGTLSFDVRSVQELHAALRGRMATEWGPEVYWYGWREFAIRDPSGYLLIFSEETNDPSICHEGD
jgi:hypothetical protein